MKKFLFLIALLFISATTLTGCNPKKEVDGSFKFIIYESDSNNNDLSDNKIVATYIIEYKECKTVTDALIKKDGNKFYFSEDSEDYLILEDSAYGLTYTKGYFKNYDECVSGAIDVSWSYTAVNGNMSSYGIGETPLEGLEEFGFVINGWK